MHIRYFSVFNNLFKKNPPPEKQDDNNNNKIEKHVEKKETKLPEIVHPTKPLVDQDGKPLPDYGIEKTNLVDDKRINDDEVLKHQAKEENEKEISSSHEVLAHVESLGSEDRVTTENIDKAIAVAEAETEARKEKEKKEKESKGVKGDEKEKEKEQEKSWMAQTKDNIKYTFISKET